MLGLPLKTEVNKPLPKTAIFRSFGSSSLPRERFDNDISRIAIVNELSPTTLNIEEGKTVKSIFVLEVMLKRKEYDCRNIGTLAKLIPQKMLFVLRMNDMMQLVVMYTQLIISDWYRTGDFKLQLFGLNLDTVWEHIVQQVGNIQIEDEHSLDEQIVADAERGKIEKQIEMLEKRCRAERQAHKKYELHKQIIELNKLL